VYLSEQQRGSSLHSSVFTSAAVDQEAAEADEGIGESETDVASSTDADASCTSFISSFSQNPSNVANSTSTHEDMQQHSKQCDKQTVGSYTFETNAVSVNDVPPEHQSDVSSNDRNCLTDDTEVEHLLKSHNSESSQTFNVPNAAAIIADDQGSTDDITIVSLSEVSGSSQTYDVLKSSSPTDDDPALSEDSGSSQTLSVTQSLSLNDDDQGSLTDVTETAHSDDSGSSRTVEVGDDDVPQLLDDDEVDAETSPQTEPQIPDTVESDQLPASSETTAGSVTSWAAEDASDSAKDMTQTKESGENWDDELSMDLRTDDEETPCKYNYCVVQRSSFPLGYERSKTSLTSVVIIINFFMTVVTDELLRRHCRYLRILVVIAFSELRPLCIVFELVLKLMWF